MAETKNTLLRALTLKDAIALLVGSVIGTGVFLETTMMTQQLGSPVTRHIISPSRNVPASRFDRRNQLPPGTSLIGFCS